METISTKTLRELRSEHPNLLVVNVLAEKDYDEMHLPKSVCIPVDDVDFVERVRDAADGDLDVPIVVYCTDESCPKSEFAAERLEAAGFEKVLDFEGGIKAWKNHDLPLEGTKANGNGATRKTKSSEGGNEKKAKKNPAAESKAEKSEKKSEKAGEKQDKAEAKGKEKSKKADGKSEKKAKANEETESKSEDAGKKKKKDASDKTEKKPKAKSKAKSEESRGKKQSAFKREATAEWKGMLKDGAGRMMLGSASGVSIPYTFAKRFGDEDGANPEELLGAALAGCFSMALSSEIGNAGYNVDKLKTGATVHLGKNDGGFAVNQIDLTVEAKVNEIGSDEYQELADKAKESCPISKALEGVDIRLKATLDQDS